MTTIHELRHGPPEPALAAALAEFEAAFTYPLGEGRSFRISHGDDYGRFFRAIGDATCFVAERGGRVVGAVGVAIRTLRMPDGVERRAAYVGDLKVAPDARGGLVLARLSRAADAWARPRVTAAYGVVMDGTRATPQGYTGRAGVQGFEVVGKLAVIRLAADESTGLNDRKCIAMADQGEPAYRLLGRGRYAPLGGRPYERSDAKPTWLLLPAASACGRVEDTRRAKQLFQIASHAPAPAGSDSSRLEMRSAHLACFAYDSFRAGAELLAVARRRAAALGFPALFVSVDARDRAPLLDNLRGLSEKDVVVAPATVYGAGLRIGPPWNISSSEI
jgi:hypothetical protein